MKKGRIISVLLSIFMMLMPNTLRALRLLPDSRGRDWSESFRSLECFGRHARITIGEWKILHIQLYEYK